MNQGHFSTFLLTDGSQLPFASEALWRIAKAQPDFLIQLLFNYSVFLLTPFKLTPIVSSYVNSTSHLRSTRAGGTDIKTTQICLQSFAEQLILLEYQSFA